MLIRIASFSSSDWLPDQPSHALPLHVLSGGKNFAFDGAQVTVVGGYDNVYGAVGMGPLYGVAGVLGETPWVLLLGLSVAYVMQDATFTDVTGTSLVSADLALGWTGSVMNGIAVVNNEINDPFYYDGTSFGALPNWPPADLVACTCASLRAYKGYLVAGGVVEDGVEYPQVLRWSNQADPGFLPSSWDVTDETNDSGRVALSGTPGVIVDSLTLGGVHMIYKSDAIYKMQEIGGVFIHDFSLVSSVDGVFGKNCVADTGSAHVVLTKNDVKVVTESAAPVSIANFKVRKAIFTAIQDTTKARTFVVYNKVRDEVMVCVAGAGSAWANSAFIWNVREGKWSYRELPALAYAVSTIKQNLGMTFDADVGDYEADTTPFDDGFGLTPQFIGLSFEQERLYSFDVGNTADGALVTVQMQHDSYDFADVEKVGPEVVKLVTRVRPHVTPGTAAGTVLSVEIGTQMELGDAIAWGTARTFTVGTTRDVYFRSNGRYISWRVSSAVDAPWGLDGMDIEYKVGGVY